jgi:hypothetical protein
MNSYTTVQHHVAGAGSFYTLQLVAGQYRRNIGITDLRDL